PLCGCVVGEQTEKDRVHQHPSRRAAVGIKCDGAAPAHAVLLGADQSQRTRFLDKLWKILDTPLALAARKEITQAADDLAGSQRLIRRLLQRVRGARLLNV